MGYRSRELFRQEFTNSDQIDVEHNLDREYVGIRVLIGEDVRPDLISGISVNNESPTNDLTVSLTSAQTGAIQIVSYDVVPVGVLSASQLVELGLGNAFVLGGDYAYAEDLTESSTNSVTFVQKLRLSVSDIAGGTYHVGTSFTWNGTATGVDFLAQLELNDTDVLWNMRGEPQDSNADQKYFAQGLGFPVLAAGNHTFDLDFRVNNASEIFRIAQARIEFWRIT